MIADIEKRLDKAKSGVAQFIAELRFDSNPDVAFFLGQIQQLARIDPDDPKCFELVRTFLFLLVSNLHSLIFFLI